MVTCRAVRQRAINFSEFYDSSRERYARFAAKEEESFARPLVRSPARSLVRSLARSWTRGKKDDGSRDVGGMRRCSCNCESICIVSLSALPSLLPGGPSSSSVVVAALSDPASAFLARPFFLPPSIRLSRAVVAVHAPPSAPLGRFYLIALLCFIEQLLRSRAVCFFFFTVTTGNSCARDFWI